MADNPEAKPRAAPTMASVVAIKRAGAAPDDAPRVTPMMAQEIVIKAAVPIAGFQFKVLPPS